MLALAQATLHDLNELQDQLASTNSTFSEKGDQLENCDLIFIF